MAKSLEVIERFYDRVLAAGRVPLTLGGDHTIGLPILRAVARRHGSVSLVHVDAHADVNDEIFGERIAHGTPFRRAVEEGLLPCDRVRQIGLRGSGTPEVGGLTVPQALEIIRGCRGLKLVGADLVEAAPPYDPIGNTALLGANLLYEMSCVLPGVPLR